MMFCVRSSAPCLELFSAAPVDADSSHCPERAPSPQGETQLPFQSFLEAVGAQVTHPPKARAAKNFLPAL